MMRFSFRSLLLLFPAYFFGVLIATAFDTKLVSYTLHREMIATHLIRRVIEYDEIDHLGVEIPIEIINQWLAFEIPSSHPEIVRLQSARRLDSWGNPYRCVRNVKSPDGKHVSLGVYSTGIDGVSRTNGNDPDDINTWNDKHHIPYYLALAAEEDRKTYAMYGAVITPFTYLGLAAILKLVRWFRSLHYEDAIKFTTTEKGKVDR